jgi:hypothetical protein
MHKSNIILLLFSLFCRFSDKDIYEKLAPVPIFVLKGSNSVPYVRHSRELEADVVSHIYKTRTHTHTYFKISVA